MKQYGLRVSIILIMLLSFHPAHALQIILNDYNNNLTTQQMGAFNEAADLWEALLFDDVTVRIDVGFKDMNSNTIIGGALSYGSSTLYSSIRDALFVDALSANDATATANLHTGNHVNTVINSLDLTPEPQGYLYNTDSYSVNTNLYVNRANLKALGLLSDDSLADATINFNTQFAFDYERNDINSNQMDFIGVAAHEIGHALGFVSGVDIIDSYTYPNGPKNPNSSYTDDAIGDSILYSVLDLYRYSDLSFAQGAGTLDWSVLSDPFFSIDGGVTNTALFSTGAFNGDGRQASHWKDNLGLGLMDPTFAFGEFGDITALDITAMDVIGWDLTINTKTVPEPGTIMLLGCGLLGIARISRKK